MRTLNMKSNKNTDFTPWAIKKVRDVSDKHPCWYVKIESDGEREDAKWIVGVKEDGEKPIELEVMASKLGDVRNEEFWNHFISYEFAITLMDTFKNGGVKEVMQMEDR